MECNIGKDAIFLPRLEMRLLFMYIYKGRLVKILANIAFLFYKETHMKYLILYYNHMYYISHTLDPDNIELRIRYFYE